jgi:PAS domain S-box-containing protein
MPLSFDLGGFKIVLQPHQRVATAVSDVFGHTSAGEQPTLPNAWSIRRHVSGSARALNHMTRYTPDEDSSELRDRLFSSEARLQGILDHSPAVISLKDLDGRFLLVNRQFERDFGVTSAGIVGKTASDLFPRRLADIYTANDTRALQSGQGIDVDEPAVIGGAVRLYAASKFPLIDRQGRPYALCGIASDMTERRRAEDELKIARIEAERANRAKSRFLSRMSHDLRTPLNAVLGFAQLLETERLPPEQQECVQQITRGGRLLLDLINEVLDISRIEAGRLSLAPEPVDVRDVVRSAVDLVVPLAAAREVTLAIEDAPDLHPAVFADRQRLSQILLNLLSNAVKYNRVGGRVNVAYGPSGPKRFRIRVSDTGGGIPRDKLQLLFTPFERLGAESTSIEGTGLGLSVSRGLAEAMGGSLGVASEVGRGSTFWVELFPVTAYDPHEEVVTAAEAPVSATRPATVLYIEDNVSNARLIERVLRRRPGVQLVHAAQGQAGIRTASEIKPDVIVLDLHLPDLCGAEVLRLLQANATLQSTPVIVLTADAAPEQRRRMLASGAAAYLTKPLEIKEILATLDRLLTGTPSIAHVSRG